MISEEKGTCKETYDKHVKNITKREPRNVIQPKIQEKNGCGEINLQIRVSKNQKQRNNTKKGFKMNKITIILSVTSA